MKPSIDVKDNEGGGRRGLSKEPQVQGVFVLRHEGRKLKAAFVPVDTGITGTTDIEVTSGLKAGDEIVTGSYKTLRELKSGAW